MPKYRVRLSDGRTVTVQADQPPTEEQILAQVGPRATDAPTEAEPSAPAGGMLPTAGGFAGSLLGTLGGIPGRIAGAAAGGALGKGAELFLDDKDDTLGDSLKAMGAEGAKQGAYEAAGGAIGKGLKAVGGGLYRVALRPSKALQQEFPGVVQAGLREGLPVTQRGAQKAATRTMESAKQADTMIAAAEKGGAAPLKPREVLTELGPVKDTLKRRASLGLPDETGALTERVGEFARRNKGGIPLTKAQGLKREAQDMADTAFRQQERGAVIKSDEALTNKAVAKGFRMAIESRVPGVAPVNQRTRSLMGVSQALDDASTRNLVFDRVIGAGAGLSGGMLAGQGDVSTGLAGAGLAAGLVSPAFLSRAGIAAARSAPIASYTPQGLRLAALLAQLTGEAPAEGQ
jgi:hypothetical protein